VHYVHVNPIRLHKGSWSRPITTQRETRNGKSSPPGNGEDLIEDAVASALPEGLDAQSPPTSCQSDRQLRRRAVPMATAGSPGADTSSALWRYAPHGAARSSPARIRPRSTARRPMPRAIPRQEFVAAASPPCPNHPDRLRLSRRRPYVRCWSIPTAPARSTIRLEKVLPQIFRLTSDHKSAASQALPRSIAAPPPYGISGRAPNTDGGFSLGEYRLVRDAVARSPRRSVFFDSRRRARARRSTWRPGGRHFCFLSTSDQTRPTDLFVRRKGTCVAAARPCCVDETLRRS